MFHCACLVCHVYTPREPSKPARGLRARTERNRCAWAADLNRRIWRSRCRVGWWETSARLFAYLSVQWTTDGITVRQAAG